MTSDDRLIAAAWSAITWDPDEAAPPWFHGMLQWHIRRLPVDIQDDFISLATIELMQEKRQGSGEVPYREDVQRALNRVRQRLLTDVGLTTRSKYRKREPLIVDPEAPTPTSDSEAEARDLMDLLCEHLTAEQILILHGLIDGRSERDIADSLGKSTRTIQRKRLRIAEVLSRIL